MKRHVLALVVCGALVGGGGCVLVEQNPFDLTPREVAALKVEFGADLSSVPKDKLEEAVEKLTGMNVSDVRVNGKNSVTVIPDPAILEIAQKSAPSIIDNVISNPTPYGIAASVVGIVGVVAGVLSKRSARKKEKKDA